MGGAGGGGWAVVGAIVSLSRGAYGRPPLSAYDQT